MMSAVSIFQTLVLLIVSFSAGTNTAAADDQEIFYQCFAQQKVDGYTSPEFCRCVSDLSINRLNPEDYSLAVADYRHINQLQRNLTSSQQSGTPLSDYEDKAGRIISDCIPCQQSGSLDCVAELDQGRLWSDYQAIAANLRNGHFDRIRTGRSYSRFFADTSIIATNFCKPIIEYPMEFWTETENSDGIVISSTTPIRIDSRLEENYGRHVAVWADEAVSNSFEDFCQSLQRREISFRPINEALWMIQLRQGLANYLGAGCATGDTFHDTYKNMILFELGEAPRIPANRGKPVGMAIDGIDKGRLERAMAAITQRQKERQAALTQTGPLNCHWESNWDGPSTISGDPAGTYKTEIHGETLFFALYPRADLAAQGPGVVAAYQGLGVIDGTQCIVTVSLGPVLKGTGRFTLFGHSNQSTMGLCEDTNVFRTKMRGSERFTASGLNGVAASSESNSFEFKIDKVPWISQSEGQCDRDATIRIQPHDMPRHALDAVKEFETSVLRVDSSNATKLPPDGFWRSISE
ncbi:MAG: hypothetical protein AAGL69_14895 [Pseudomonadota bacterium]